MVRLTLLFLVLALIAGLFGFGFIASSFALLARVVFFVFLVLLLISLLAGRRLTA